LALENDDSLNLGNGLEKEGSIAFKKEHYSADGELLAMIGLA
jgi:hypothetical protein